MSAFSRFLNMLWFRRGYTEDEILNAENENDLYDHTKALESAQSALADRIAANRRLHRVLQTSQARSQEFGEFEELVKEASRVRRHG